MKGCGDPWCRYCWPPIQHIYVILALTGTLYVLARALGLDL